MNDIAAVVLAAGASRRMGIPKQLVAVDGRPMLVRIVECVLAAGVDPVIIVLGAYADEIRLLLAGKPVTVVMNRQWEEGLASSLRAGLAAVGQAEAVLFVPADMPRLTPGAIRAIIDEYRATGKTIIVPTCRGQRGNPVLFARSWFPQLAQLRGDVGGRVLVAAHQADVHAVEIGDEGILLDIDTPDDLSKKRRD